MNTLNKDKEPLRILKIINVAAENANDYFEYTLPLSRQHRFTFVSFYEPKMFPPKPCEIFSAQGSVFKFIQIIRRILLIRKYDIVHCHHPNTSFLFLIALLSIRSRINTPLVFTVHSSYPNYKERNRLFLYIVFKYFDRIVFCSKASYDSFPERYHKIIEKKIGVITNGVNLDRIKTFTQSISVHKESNEFTIVSVGRLIKLKNHITQVKTIEKICNEDLKLVIIGDGPEKDELIKLINKLGLEKKVHMTGLISKEKLYEYLINADVFISTSTIEGMPYSVLEAMACGCPIVLSDIAPHREIARHCDSITLISPYDFRKFAHTINELINMNDIDRLAFGNRCRILVGNRYSIGEFLDNYNQLYLNLVEKLSK
jgi:glycosyltransferase involved in cell wall biosynthesis